MRTVNKDDNYTTVILIVEHSCFGRACLAGRAFQESFPLQEMRKTQRETI